MLINSWRGFVYDYSRWKKLIRRQFNMQTFGNIIQYVDGIAYGLTTELKSVFMGSENEIKEYLENPDKQHENTVINEIINAERNILKEDKDGKSTTATTVTALRTPKSKQRIYQRIRPSSFSRDNARNFKPIKNTTKPAIYKT
jgi:hypothetical protein